jgi:hypothetical protein
VAGGSDEIDAQIDGVDKMKGLGFPEDHADDEDQ